MKTICIIPARGGSKRIPRKNIKRFLGKPIIAYSIESALSSRIFDEVMVSTDDEEIANLASGLGAMVPFLRSKENSDDKASTFDVIKEVIDNYEKQGKRFDFACCLYPTAPFITANHLIEAKQKLEEMEIEAVFTIVKYAYPIQRSLSFIVNGQIRMNNEKNLKTRSQDLTANYHDAGLFYFYNTESYLNYRSVYVMKAVPILLSELECQDIDTSTDWKLAELKYQLLNNLE